MKELLLTGTFKNTVSRLNRKAKDLDTVNDKLQQGINFLTNN